MSGNIRKQLGPVRKRLQDRIEDANALLGNQEIDVANLKSVRSKLVANKGSLNELITKLEVVTDITDDERILLEQALEVSVTLNMDASEVITGIDDALQQTHTTVDEKVSPAVEELESLKKEKLLREVENLKLDNLHKQTKIDMLSDPKRTDEKKGAKLPKIEPVTFSGRWKDWPSFWDWYKATIHENESLSKIDKFKYLKGCLQNEAKETLEGFNLSNAQYDEAVNLLQERYDDVEFIIHNHYDELSKLPKSTNLTIQLRKTLNIIETHLRSLKSLGESIENNQMVFTLKTKFPKEINLKLEETRVGDWTVEKLRKMLRKLIVAREKSEESGAVTESSNEFEEDFEEATGEHLLANAKPTCVYCGLGHWHDECQKYKTMQLRKAQIKGRCFVCLSKKHKCRDCQSKKSCFYCQIKSTHHSSLCPDKFDEAKVREGENVPTADPGLVGDDILVNFDEKVIMKTAKVKIKSFKTKQFETGMAMLDTGSKHTHITASKAKALGLKCGNQKRVQVNTFGTTDSSEITIAETIIMVRQVDGSCKRMKARICNNITGKMMKSRIPLENYDEIWKGLTLADELPTKNRSMKLDILIGNDYYDDIVKTDKVRIDDGLYLINSTLGWLFSGRIPGRETPETDTMMLVEDVDPAKSYWELETIGITEQMHNEEEEEAQLIQNLRKTIRKNSNRYVLSWPWKEPRYELCTNYELCFSRLESLMKGFKNEKGKQTYNEIIQQQIKGNIVERANQSQEYKRRKDVVLHYLPHHAVVSGEKTRIVIEGNAKSSKVLKSLNQCLYRGPNLVANLVGVLLRFRLQKIGLVADIKSAYVQMELNEKDRDTVRFLWLKDITKGVNEENIVELRFCRVIWGIICAAFLLAFTLMFHLEKYSNDVAEDISRNIYVDNLITGVNSPTEGKEYYIKTKEIFSEAGMNMCKWSSNNEEVMKQISEEDRVDDNRLTVLGIIWNRKQDTLSLNKTVTKIESPLTKRKILKVTSSIFDPLGLLSPAVLEMKLILQEVWKAKLGWDEKVPDHLEKCWNKKLQNIKDIEKFHFNRRVVNEFQGDSNLELVTFTDASKHAYAAAVYLLESRPGSNRASLIFSKSRLAPINSNLTIPRLELLGLLIGCRISKFVLDHLGLKAVKRKVYTDSKCSIEWVNSTKSLRRYVSARVKEIKGHDVSICYVNSGENPADVATRGQGIKSLENNDLWWNGPSWLSLPKCAWPCSSFVLSSDIQLDIEAEEKSNVLYEVGLLTNDVPMQPFGINEEAYSSHSRLTRVTAWCLRFVSNLKSRIRYLDFLTSDEIKQACDVWLKYIQKVHFDGVLSAFQKNTKHKLISQLGLYLDTQGIIRCSGRLTQHSHPQLLPKKSHFTKLCIIRSHRRLLHAGVPHTLAEIRGEFWVVNGRAAVKKALRNCLICLHWEGGPFRTPNFARFPDYVLSSNYPPFTFVGIDYLGPLLVKDKNGTKDWICLITCLNVRAIHLEIVSDMTTHTFLLALRRFFARRGTPSLIISDNAKNFKLGSSVLNRIWKNVVRSNEVQSYIADSGIRWKFITDLSPWKGGFYERLVALTKRSLRKTLGRLRVSNEELITIVHEVEAVINSRPLTYIDDDINVRQILTPAHFLSLNYRTGTPNFEVPSKFDDSSVKLLKMWKAGQDQLNEFWKVWTEEYLQVLRERKSFKMKPIKGEIKRLPQIGEAVIVKEDYQPRGKWKIARIVNLLKSDVDGKVRGAQLSLPSGILIKRPFKLLYPLELLEEEK